MATQPPNFAVILTRIYEKYAPDKLGAVESILERFSGREAKLVQELVRKFNISDAEQAEIGISLEHPPPSYTRSFTDAEVTDAEGDSVHVVQATAVMSYDQAEAHGAYPPMPPASGGSFLNLPTSRRRDEQGRIMPSVPYGANTQQPVQAHPLAARGIGIGYQSGYSNVQTGTQMPSDDRQGNSAKSCARIIFSIYVCGCCCFLFLLIISATVGGSMSDDDATNSTTQALVRGF